VTSFKSRPRILRLLPGVMLACGALLALKASGIVHDAFALESTPAAGAMAPAPQSVNQDFAGGDGAMASAAEVDVLTSLGKRRAAMDAREAEIQTETNILAAAESRVDAKIAQLKDLQTQIAALLAQRDAAQEKQVAALIKTYGPDGMKAAKAAAIFNTLPDDVLVPVAQGLKPGDLGAILSSMNPDAAEKLTLKLASKLTLPDTTAAMAPVAPLAVPAPAAKTTANQGPDPASPAATPGAAASKPKS
jgi:flagellar motility protein MotE (MotC chaperone)